jgi:hypothetical protein
MMMPKLTELEAANLNAGEWHCGPGSASSCRAGCACVRARGGGAGVSGYPAYTPVASVVCTVLAHSQVRSCIMRCDTDSEGKFGAMHGGLMLCTSLDVAAYLRYFATCCHSRNPSCRRCTRLLSECRTRRSSPFPRSRHTASVGLPPIGPHSGCAPSSAARSALPISGRICRHTAPAN